MSSHESGHSGRKVHETVSPSVCLGGMEDRENKEIILCWCHPHYWHKSDLSHAVSTVGGRRRECCAPDRRQEVQTRQASWKRQLQ